jgi:hypothetical protein
VLTPLYKTIRFSRYANNKKSFRILPEVLAA